MQKSLLDLDQLLLDEHICYCLFLVNGKGEIFVSSNLKETDEAVQNMAGLYSQLQGGTLLNSAIADTLSKMTVEESQLFAKHLFAFRGKTAGKPVIRPIDNVQKPPKAG